MTLTPANLAALKAELQNDPATIGYAPHLASGDDGGLAALLNAPRGGQTCQSGPLTKQQVLGAITLSDIPTGRGDEFLHWVDEMAELPVGLDLNNPKIVADFEQFFAPSSASFTALSNLRTVSGCSRAQALFGVACVIDAMDVARAMGR